MAGKRSIGGRTPPRFRGGQAPLGFTRTPAGQLRPLAREARLVRAMFREYPRLGSLAALMDWLDGQGLSNRGRPWTRQTLFWILKNPAYLGWVRMAGAPSGRVRAHPAIVSETVFKSVRHCLAGKCRNPNPQKGRRGDERPAPVATGTPVPGAQAAGAAR